MAAFVGPSSFECVSSSQNFISCYNHAENSFNNLIKLYLVLLFGMAQFYNNRDAY